MAILISYLFILVPLIIAIIGLVVLARAVCSTYKYQELDDNDEPLVKHGQGDYQKVTRPSDL